MRSRLFLALVPLLLALAAPVQARGTLDSILPQIRAEHPGRLSDAEPWTDNDGATHYRIKWMTPEGRIIFFDADTRTGRYSSAGGDEGGQWRDHRGEDRDNGARRGDRGTGEEGGDRGDGHRNHWNGEDGGDSHGGDNHGAGQGGAGQGGDWRGHATDGGGDWRGRGRSGGDWGGWRGGGNGGDNGGHHHHGN